MIAMCPQCVRNVSAMCPQCVRNVSAHLILVTDEIQNVGQEQHLQKC